MLRFIHSLFIHIFYNVIHPSLLFFFFSSSPPLSSFFLGFYDLVHCHLLVTMNKVLCNGMYYDDLAVIRNLNFFSVSYLFLEPFLQNRFLSFTFILFSSIPGPEKVLLGLFPFRKFSVPYRSLTLSNLYQ